MNPTQKKVNLRILLAFLCELLGGIAAFYLYFFALSLWVNLVVFWIGGSYHDPFTLVLMSVPLLLIPFVGPLGVHLVNRCFFQVKPASFLVGFVFSLTLGLILSFVFVTRNIGRAFDDVLRPLPGIKLLDLKNALVPSLLFSFIWSLPALFGYNLSLLFRKQLQRIERSISQKNKSKEDEAAN